MSDAGPPGRLTPQQNAEIKAALEYVKLIVVESDGYPMEHSADDIRTLLGNAFLAGMSEATTRRQALEQQVEQLCGDVKAIQTDYADAHHRAEKAEAGRQALEQEVERARKALAPFYHELSPDVNDAAVGYLAECVAEQLSTFDADVDRWNAANQQMEEDRDKAISETRTALQHLGKAEIDLAACREHRKAAMAGLQRLADKDDCRCEHDDENCCAFVEDFACPSCIFAVIDRESRSPEGPKGMTTRFDTTTAVGPSQNATAEPQEPIVVPLDDPSVPESLVPIPRPTDTSQSDQALAVALDELEKAEIEITRLRAERQKFQNDIAAVVDSVWEVNVKMKPQVFVDAIVKLRNLVGPLPAPPETT